MSKSNKNNDCIFSDFKETMISLSLILGIVIMIAMIALLVINNSYYSQFGDDNAQYFPFMNDFVLRFKSNKLSFYSFSNYMGSSYFVDTYYISFDIFSIIPIVFSFFMPFSFAFGFQEVSKLFFGVLLFAFYLHLRGRGNKALFWTSLIYAVCGANVVNQVFPIYYSLIFYLPLTAVVMHYFMKGKYFLLPLLICSLIFYNYYNAYLCIIFAFALLVLNNIIDYKKNSKNLYFELGNFILLGLLGVLMGSVVLIPSAFAILKDTTKGGSMTLNFEELIKFKDNIQYLRILGEIFTPTVSTDYWGFSNNGWLSYVNMHLSLYITVTGLLIALSIYMFNDRESNVYKAILPLEVIILFMPIWYMVFSGSTGTYTRWFIALSFINLLIVAKVIDKSNFDFYVSRYKQLIKNAIILIVALIVANLYVEKLFEVNLFTYISKFGNLPIKFKPNPGSTLNLKLDAVFLIVAIVLIVLGTVACFIRKVRLTPYFLTVELVIGMVFVYMAPFRVQNFMVVDSKRNSVNDYLNTYVNNYDDFYRIYIGSQIDKGGNGENFNRTQLQATTLRNFHSWHTATSHEFTHLIFGTDINNNASNNLDNPYLDMQQLLGAKYVLSNSNRKLGLPNNYVELKNTNDGSFTLYENTNFTPFVVYNTLLDVPTKTVNDKTKYYLEGSKYEKLATLLNYVYYTGDNDKIKSSLEISDSKKTSIKTYLKTYTTNNSNAPWDFVSNNYLAYKLDLNTNSNIPTSGMFNYYFGSEYATEFDDVYIGYRENGQDHVWRSCFGSSRICYYDKLPERDVYLYIKNTKSMADRRKGDNANLDLRINYYDNTYYQNFTKEQALYTNRVVKYNDSGLDVSFDKTVDDDIVVALPVAYSECWKNNKGYDVINVNGGMTGIYIPKGSGSQISFNLKYEPWNLKLSGVLSAGGFIAYTSYLYYEFMIKGKKKENKIEK